MDHGRPFFAFLALLATDCVLAHLSNLGAGHAILADPVTLTVLTVATVVSAAAATTTAVMNYEASQRAANAQKNLANQQEQKLKDEQSNRDAEAAIQAKTGANFGFGSESTVRNVVSTGFGFGSGFGNAQNTGEGRSQLLGGGQ